MCEVMPLHTDPVGNVPVTAMSTQEVPGCTVQLVTCKMKGGLNCSGGLTEPSDAIGLTKVFVYRSVSSYY